MDASNTITVDELMEQFRLTEEQCNCVITDAHLGEISRNLVANWRSLVSQVGMPRNSKSDIEHTFITEEERREAFFFQWKRRNGHTATYKRLISALLAIDNRADAEGVCDMLAKSPHPQEESSLNSVAQNPANSMVATVNQEDQRHQLTSNHDERRRSFAVRTDFTRNNEDSPLHEQNLTFMVPTAEVKGAVSGAIIGALAVGAGMGLVYALGDSTAAHIVAGGSCAAIGASIVMPLLRAMGCSSDAADVLYFSGLVGGVVLYLALINIVYFAVTNISYTASFNCAFVVSLCIICVFGCVTGSAAEAVAIVTGMWLLCYIGVVGAKVGATAKVLAIGVVVGLLFGGITRRVRAKVVTPIITIVKIITLIYLIYIYL